VVMKLQTRHVDGGVELSCHTSTVTQKAQDLGLQGRHCLFKQALFLN